MAETSEGFSKGRYISNHTLAETSKAGRLARIRLGACQRVAKNSDEKRMERTERVVEWKVVKRRKMEATITGCSASR